MAKRPTPKKRRAKSDGRAQHSEFQRKNIVRLKNKTKSPFAKVAPSKQSENKALKSVTKIKA
jgi:hypothetical protein